MRGHEPLIAMRKRGMVPTIVFLSIGHDRLGQASDWIARTPEMATVFIEPADRPELLDLRFLVGLIVKVDGEDRCRVERVAKACMTAKAARVIATTFDFANGQPIAGITDTKGDLTWQP